jgi:hypothetical protein
MYANNNNNNNNNNTVRTILITVKCQIIELWLPSFESSFLNTDNSICYESFQNDYTQLIALFDIFLTLINCCCVMHNTIEKREPKANYLALYGKKRVMLYFDSE